MLISKFDLCKPEWLELVFAKRNKEYGAYYLRQHYAGNIIKAMGITFFSVVSIFLVLGIIIRSKPAELFTKTDVPLAKYVPVPPVAPPKEPVHQNKASAPKTIVATTKFVPPVIVSTPPPTEPPKITEMPGEIGQTNIAATGTGPVTSIDNGKGDAPEVKAEDTKVYSTAGLEEEPEPYGGAAAWTKFLQKNLRYPNEAMEKQMSGKVWVTFIVEKNGHISSLVVERGAGYGMDEEALRVLKLAPPWKPGKQNGQPVRVKYTLPLNFIMNQ